MLKFSATQLAAIGAKTHEEAAEKLTGLFAAIEAQGKSVTDFTGKLEASEKKNAEFATKLEASEKKLGEVEAKIPTEDKVKEIAKAAGSEAAVNAIAGTGKGTPAPGGALDPNKATEKSAVENLIAAGKYDEAFAADKNIQSEFITKENYGAFMRAQVKGMVGKTYSKQ